MTVITVKMETANYVNNIGKQINDSTKYRVHLDRTSITNLVLINHLTEVYNWLEKELAKEDTEFKQSDLNKISNYILCMKKEMNFFENRVIDEDCILTEVSEKIIQE